MQMACIVDEFTLMALSTDHRQPISLQTLKVIFFVGGLLTFVVRFVYLLGTSTCHSDLHQHKTYMTPFEGYTLIFSDNKLHFQSKSILLGLTLSDSLLP